MDVFVTNLIECYTHLRGIVIHWATGGVALVLFVLTMIAAYFDHRSYALIRKVIQQAKWRLIYFVFLRKAEACLDRFYGPFARKAILTTSLDRTLLLAFAYPFVLTVLAWVAGGPGTISAIPLMPIVPAMDERWIVFAAFVLAFTITAFASDWAFSDNGIDRWLGKRLPNRSRTQTVLSVILGVAFIVLIAVGLPYVFGEILPAVVVTTSSSKGYLVFGVLSTTVFASCLISATAAGIVATFAYTGVLTGIGAVALATLIFGFGAVAGLNLNNFAMLALTCVLPLANTLLDWISVNASRWLLFDLNRRGPRAGALTILWHGAVDIAIAALSLIGIALVLPAVIAGYNRLLAAFDAPIFQWLPFLDAAMSDVPFAGLAVTGMLFTTLVPTVLHLFAVVAIFLVPKGPGFGQQKFQDLLASENPPLVQRLVVVFWFVISVLGSVSIVIAVGCLGYRFFESGLHVICGRGLAELAIWVSQSLGDPVWASRQ